MPAGFVVWQNAVKWIMSDVKLSVMFIKGCEYNRLRKNFFETADM